MSNSKIEYLLENLDKPVKFMNRLSIDILDIINRDFIFKYKTLKYPKIVAILVDNGIDYSDNQFELIEIAIKYKYYDTLNILINKYKDDINKLFEWGFERDGLIIDYDYNRMSKFFLIDNYFDKKMIQIFSQSQEFVNDYIKYKKKLITIPKKYHKQTSYKITRKGGLSN